MKLSENIYTLRKKQSLSQEQLAEKINVTRQTISNWELGETSPNPEQLIKLSGVFGISIDGLVGNDTYYMGVDTPTNMQAAEAVPNEKNAPKSAKFRIRRFLFAASLAIAALWAILAVLFFAVGIDYLVIFDIIICLIWLAIAIIQYNKFNKKNSD